MPDTDGYAFFISRVGEKGSPERKRADEVYEYIVVPVLENHELPVVRADLDPTPGQVTAQIMRHLLESDVVIADLTGRNPNVYYELGVAHAFVKPVVIMVDKASTLTFDTQNERVITIGDEGSVGVSQAETAKEQLSTVLDVVLSDGYAAENLVTSVASAQSLDDLAASDPVAEQLSTLVDEVRRNQTILSAVRRGTMVTEPDRKSLRNYARWTLSEGLVDAATFGSRLITEDTSDRFDSWVNRAMSKAPRRSDYGPDEAPF